MDPEEEEDPFNNYEVQSEAKLESFPNIGLHRLSFDSTTFMESGRSHSRESLSLRFFFFSFPSNHLRISSGVDLKVLPKFFILDFFFHPGLLVRLGDWLTGPYTQGNRWLCKSICVP